VHPIFVEKKEKGIKTVPQNTVTNNSLFSNELFSGEKFENLIINYSTFSNLGLKKCILLKMILDIVYSSIVILVMQSLKM
jgi:hypothetical protein